MIRIWTFAVIASITALANTASAATVNAINNYGDALAMVDKTQSLDLPVGASWAAAPLTVSPDASLGGQYRSPFESANHSSVGYYSVGVSNNYSGTGNPAILNLDNPATTFSLLWGSPDYYNRLELYDGMDLLISISGAGFTVQALEASFVWVTAGLGEQFTQARFFSDGRNAFEFSNVGVSPVPVPAAVWLFGSALLGFVSLSRRKKLKA